MNISFRLRHRVDIQEPIYTVDSGTGARVVTWASVQSFLEPAAITPLSGKEYIAAQSVQAGITTRITMRHQEILPDMRIVHNGKIYNVRAVLEDPLLSRHINLMCDSGVNDG